MAESQKQEYLKQYQEMRTRVIQEGFWPSLVGFFLCFAGPLILGQKFSISFGLGLISIALGLFLLIKGIFYIGKHYRCPSCEAVLLDRMNVEDFGIVLNPNHCQRCGLSFK